MSFDFVIWDLDEDPHGNVKHIAEHGITQTEVEEVFEHPLDHDFSHSTGRPVIFGLTSTGKYLLVVYEPVDAVTVYPITAFEVPERYWL